MFRHFVLFLFSLMGLLCEFHTSSCDQQCADKPVFTPSRLVVKFGDPTSARCFVCQRDCLNNLFDLEKSLGSSAKNGTTISWTVDRMTEWDTSTQCYYNNGTDYQCCTFLPITVYQPPDNVSISFVNHTGPMFEGHQYTLQCTVQDVAPVENLTVTFYRGQTALSQQQSNYNTKKTPVTEIFTLDINATKEDDGVQYWCEAELQLGPEGPQQPPVVMSQKLTATVNYTQIMDFQGNSPLIKENINIYMLFLITFATGVVLVIIITIILFITFKFSSSIIMFNWYFYCSDFFNISK